VVSRRLKPAGAGKRGQLPVLWLFSDPLRLPDPRGALDGLPRGSGLVARGLDPALRPALARQARAAGCRLVLGAESRAALRWHAGLHWPDRAPGSALLPFLLARRAGAPWAILTLAAHGRAGMARANRLRADLVFLSPAFPTRSHPGAPALGPLRWSALARRCRRPVAALGGLGPQTAGRLPRWNRGLAAIEALLQPRHSVSRKSRQGQAEHCSSQGR
jgi:thiamine-phosphate pyrophosphorylase